MQPTNDELANANMGSELRVVDTIQQMLGLVKQKADMEEDGNTVALINKISRDVASIQEKHKTFDAQKVYQYQQEKAQPVSEQDPLFVAQSYEKTAAKDVNQAPFPKTDESAGAPFESKGKATKSEDMDGSKQDTSRKATAKAE